MKDYLKTREFEVIDSPAFSDLVLASGEQRALSELLAKHESIARGEEVKSVEERIIEESTVVGTKISKEEERGEIPYTSPASSKQNPKA